VRNRRLRRTPAAGHGRPHRRPASARVPRLRLRGRRDLRRRRHRGAASARQARKSRGRAARSAPGRAAGPRTHALGDPRQALGAQRPSPSCGLGRRGAQRNRREPPRPPAPDRGLGRRCAVRHRYRAHRAPRRRRGGGRRRPADGRAPGDVAAGGLLCARRAVRPGARHARGGQERGQPHHPRRGREGGLPRQRHPGHPALHARHALPRGWRLRAPRGEGPSGIPWPRRRVATTASCRRRSSSSPGR
jgi:hypothetical protein